MRWLLQLYPRAWRERYEDEMLALLQDCRVTPATVIDLFLGAVDANLHYTDFSEGVSNMVNRMRSGVVMIFCAFMMYGVGWSLLQRLGDPAPDFQAVNHIYPQFGVLVHSVFIVGCVSFVAFLLGGLPIFLISTRRAMKNKKREVLVPFRVAVACLLIFVALTALLLISHPQTLMYLIGYLVLSALLLIVGTAAVALVVARTEFKFSELKLAFIPEVVITFCMVVSVVLATILIIAVTSHAPQLFNTQDVNSTMFITGILFMALGTIFAVMGLKRGSVKGSDELTRV